MKKLFTLLLLLISIGLHAQTCGPGSKDSVCSYGPITIASGVTTSLPSNGGLVPGFQYIFSSGSGTVTLHGCIGPIATGCVTLDSYTGGTTVRTPDEFSVKAPSAPYQYFTITPTYGAGTFTVLEVNNNTSKVGGSKLDLTATSPIVVTPNPITGTGDISCPTCGIGSGNANYTGTQDVVAKGTVVAHTLGDSTIGDDGFHATKTPNGVDTGVNGNLFTITDSTGVVGKALCNSGGTGILCPANTTTGILGVVVYIAGGLDHYCWSRCNAIWDNQTVIGDSGYIGSIAGEFHDSGNQFDTSGVQNVYANSLNAGAGTAALTSVLTPDQVAGGSIGSGGGIQNPVVVAGTGGVTVNLLAAQDATDPARWILPVSGNCGLGFAKTTATVGNKFVLEAIPGQIYTAVADGTITAQHVLIGGTATPGRVKDSGATQATGVAVGTCFMAKALAGATVGQTLPVLYLGLKFGVSGTATYSGSPGVGKPTISTGVAGQFQDSSCSDSSGSGTVQSCNTNPTFTPVSGSSILYTTTTSNTADVTVNVNSLGAKHIRKNSGAAVLASGDLVAATPVQLIYDGTYWEIATVGNAGGGLSNVAMPPAEFASSITGSVETVTKQNQAVGTYWKAPSQGGYATPFARGNTCYFTVGGPSFACAQAEATATGDTELVTLQSWSDGSGCTGGNSGHMLISSVSDSVNGAYTLIDDYNNGEAVTASYYVKNVAGGLVTPTVVFTGPGSAATCLTMNVIRVSGVDPTSPLDAHGIGYFDTASVTTSNPNDIVIATLTERASVATFVGSSGQATAIGASTYSSGWLSASIAQYYDVNTTGTYKPVITGGVGYFYGLTVSFKAAATSGSYGQPTFDYISASDIPALTKLNFLPVAFAGLDPAPSAGEIQWCSDCTVTTPATCSTASPASCVCTGSGTGVHAKYTNYMGNGLKWYCQ
jgi:hypothetical protein